MVEPRDPPAPTRRSLPSIFDGLPPGPIDFALLHERMERDFEARTLAALDRALARLLPVAEGAASCAEANNGRPDEPTFPLEPPADKSP